MAAPGEQPDTYITWDRFSEIRIRQDNHLQREFATLQEETKELKADVKELKTDFKESRELKLVLSRMDARLSNYILKNPSLPIIPILAFHPVRGVVSPNSFPNTPGSSMPLETRLSIANAAS